MDSNYNGSVLDSDPGLQQATDASEAAHYARLSGEPEDDLDYDSIDRAAAGELYDYPG